MTTESIRWLLSRRAFLGRSGAGLGTLALASLADPGLYGALALIRRERTIGRRSIAGRAWSVRCTIPPRRSG